jgi:hypothetical protein
LVVAIALPLSSKRLSGEGPYAVETPFAVEQGLERALDLARRRLPDARLAALRATYVDASGRSSGYVQYDFVSPSRAVDAPSGSHPDCAIGVIVSRGYMSVGQPWTAACSDRHLDRACTVADVLARAPGLGDAHLHISARQPGWLVDREGARGKPAMRVPDDCRPDR